MIDLYDIVKQGKSQNDIETVIQTLNLTILDLNGSYPECSCNNDFSLIYKEIHDITCRCTNKNDNSEHLYFLVTLNEVKKYFDEKMCELSNEICRLDEAKKEAIIMVTSKLL